MDKTKSKISILSVCLLLMGTMALTPLLADIAASFPGAGPTSIQVLSTLPNLFVIIFTLVAGWLATRISKKILVLAGLAFMIVAGIGGFLMYSSLSILYFWAALIGIGMGLFSPMLTLLINDNFDGKERGDMLGLETSFNNAGAIILSLLGGFLGNIAWHMGYLAYVIVVVPIFIIVAALLKKDKPVKDAGIQTASLKINGTVLYYTILVIIFIMVYNVYATNVAMFTVETGLGNASTAGIANSVSLIGGILGGFLFGFLSSKLDKHMMTLGLLLCCVGFLLTYASSSLGMALIGAFIAGISISFFMPQVIFTATRELDDEYKTMGLSIVSTFGSLGAFLSPIVFTNLAAATGDASTKFRFLFVGIIAFVLAVIMGIIIQVQKNKATNLGLNR